MRAALASVLLAALIGPGSAGTLTDAAIVCSGDLMAQYAAVSHEMPDKVWDAAFEGCHEKWMAAARAGAEAWIAQQRQAGNSQDPVVLFEITQDYALSLKKFYTQSALDTIAAIHIKAVAGVSPAPK